MKYTKESLDILEKVSRVIAEQTFHHHYHILYDIVTSYEDTQQLTYVEIGCYAGGSACLVLQRPNTQVVSIDLGDPISPEVVKENVTKLNVHNNSYTYLQGNSQDTEMVERLSKEVSGIDVLFIDGDHSYQGVINDFLLYKDLVNTRGYIVFDDYNDWQFSPEVKLAVNDIVEIHGSDYKVIGTLPNTVGARPVELLDGNEFIIHKL
jgi:cephalosporin hydroxylase